MGGKECREKRCKSKGVGKYYQHPHTAGKGAVLKTSSKRTAAFTTTQPDAAQPTFQSLIPAVNVQVNQTFNTIQAAKASTQILLRVDDEFPSLSSLSEILTLDAVASTLCATDQHSTLQHREAAEIMNKAEKVAASLRQKGVCRLVSVDSCTHFWASR
jgi:hypothetical protein